MPDLLQPVAFPMPDFPKKKFSYEDYLKLDDDNKYELIEGELIVVPRPRPRHQKVLNKLVYAFEGFLQKNPVGEFYTDLDVHLGDAVVAPDLLYISKDRAQIVGELNVQGAPDLVVEVLSPATARYDKKEKGRLYFNRGVKEFWVVDPEDRLVEVYRAGETNWEWVGVFDAEDILTTPLLPGFELVLKNVLV